MDVIQALCLLSQYFFFNSRDMEGSRHLMAAKRIALELQLSKIVSPDLALFPFSLQYPFAEAGSVAVPSIEDQGWKEKALVFWQVFVLETLWSASYHTAPSLPDVEIPSRCITTPLPVEPGAPIVRKFIFIM